MSERSEKAISYHKNFYSCSASVLCAYCDLIGMSETDARNAAMPFAGGKQGKCGAVLSAEYIMDRKLGKNADAAKNDFEKKFTDMNKSILCAELKGKNTGKPLRSCRGCVFDAVMLLDEIIDRS